MATATLSPNQTLIRRASTTTAHAVRRILATYDRATEDDRAAGREWYARARAEASLLAPHVGGIEHGAAVLSAYSPRTSWKRNTLVARHYALTGTKHYAAMAENHKRALVVTASSDPLNALTGPKTRAFARNIVGDEQAVTVDVWAARIALGMDRDDVDLVLARRGVYDALARAYRIAAARRGVSPAIMQATTWIVARNGRSE